MNGTYYKLTKKKEKKRHFYYEIWEKTPKNSA